tara:strand:- start:478 stop:1095 length:618 start_codon:yes stop_codon:yes gene_type:complete
VGVVLKIESLKKSYNEKLVFEALNLEINSKSIFWIQGYNGSGKSTLMKIIASQIEDYEGNVSYKNISIKKIGYEIHNEIFYLPSLSNLYEGLTIDENIYFFSNIFDSKGKERMNELIKIFNLNTYLNTRISELSDGIKKRVALVIAFLINSKVLLLDEPYSYLDSKSVNTLNQTIGKYKESGGTIIISDNSLFVEELSPDDSFQL